VFRVVDSFRAAVIASGAQSYGMYGKSGSAPTPFDAVDGARLAGPQGSHPLASIDVHELVRGSSDGLDGEITIKDGVRVGEAISGHLRVTARKDINARAANVRLVGVLLAEHQQSREERNSKGEVVSSEQWVDVSGSFIEELPFTEPVLPTTLTAGHTFETDFNLPAPRLGPPSAHMGSAILAWALDARWDISMGGDERVSTLVDVKQNLDYLRSGAVRLEQGALFDAWSVGDGTIAVNPLPPIVAGTELDVTVTWPGAGAGRGGRLELQADVKAPNELKGVVLYSVVVDPTVFRGGTTIRIPVPADAPPTLNDKGVSVNYRIRALVDRKLRSDLAVERSLAVL
jgi:hypothetical protein